MRGYIWLYQCRSFFYSYIFRYSAKALNFLSPLDPRDIICPWSTCSLSILVSRSSPKQLDSIWALYICKAFFSYELRKKWLLLNFVIKPFCWNYKYTLLILVSKKLVSCVKFYTYLGQNERVYTEDISFCITLVLT